MSKRKGQFSRQTISGLYTKYTKMSKKGKSNWRGISKQQLPLGLLLHIRCQLVILPHYASVFKRDMFFWISLAVIRVFSLD